MKLFHWTDKSNINSIMKNGLKPNGMGIIYLTPNPNFWKNYANVCLEVETKNITLSTFDEDNNVHEVLCWGSIPPEDIKIYKEYKLNDRRDKRKNI